MNKFNRPRGNAVKQRKIKLRSTKKRSHVKEKAASLRVKVGGQRTGALRPLVMETTMLVQICQATSTPLFTS